MFCTDPAERSAFHSPAWLGGPLIHMCIFFSYKVAWQSYNPCWYFCRTVTFGRDGLWLAHGERSFFFFFSSYQAFSFSHFTAMFPPAGQRTANGLRSAVSFSFASRLRLVVSSPAIIHLHCFSSVLLPQAGSWTRWPLEVPAKPTFLWFLWFHYFLPFSPPFTHSPKLSSGSPSLCFFLSKFSCFPFSRILFLTRQLP